MYPIYPSLALNAAISLHILLFALGSTNPKSLLSKVPPSVKLALAGAFFIVAVNMGLWRIAGMTTAYDAPLKVYSSLHNPGMASAGETVCLGKEWYRLPSSYFLPNNMRAKFVKSAFTGLLPGEFRAEDTALGVLAGASVIPPGMNDENLEDLGKYVSATIDTLRMYALSPDLDRHCKLLLPGGFSST